jgi:methylmalonyl-CoA carboxyltransferase large subunit
MMVADTIPQELLAEIETLRLQVASLTSRIANLEAITEEEVLAIAAAVAAFMGVRAHIRQIRLVSSRSWAQEGRVTIQASHRLHG